ncbi:hypothetical protein RC1_3990 [Rhodospirillum centenum SW]|uniref:Uncharacterized protein n=1 Tax=Rhodospirillum centenum (strain ATCC 51521 / SW) TaxID=414684 RepID=B6IYF7_RHOCS|nr:hypothetical protein RC1_3990 [Rhodospirillum centenum SW]
MTGPREFPNGDSNAAPEPPGRGMAGLVASFRLRATDVAARGMAG